MARQTAPTRWTASAKYPLLWHTWGDGRHLVYHTGSGDTHMLNAVAAEVLRQLDGRATTVAEVTTRVARALEIDPAELAPHVDRLVPYLEDLGLVEPVE